MQISQRGILAFVCGNTPKYYNIYHVTEYVIKFVRIPSLRIISVLSI